MQSPIPNSNSETACGLKEMLLEVCYFSPFPSKIVREILRIAILQWKEEVSINYDNVTALASFWNFNAEQPGNIAKFHIGSNPQFFFWCKTRMLNQLVRKTRYLLQATKKLTGLEPNVEGIVLDMRKQIYILEQEVLSLFGILLARFFPIEPYLKPHPVGCPQNAIFELHLRYNRASL
jgi:hypothetical protein